MSALVPSMATLAISTIYVAWTAYQHSIQRRDHVLRERVAYMLWVMATREEKAVN